MDSDDKSPEKPQTEISTSETTQFATILLTEKRTIENQRFLIWLILAFIGTIYLNRIGAWDEYLTGLSWVVLLFVAVKFYPVPNIGSVTRVTNLVHCVNCRENISLNKLGYSSPLIEGEIFNHIWYSTTSQTVSSPVSYIAYPFQSNTGVVINPSYEKKTTVQHSELRREVRMNLTCPKCSGYESYTGHVKVHKQIESKSNQTIYTNEEPTSNRDDYVTSVRPLKRLRLINIGGYDRNKIVVDAEQEKILNSIYRIYNPDSKAVLECSTIMFESFKLEDLPVASL
jgi:hypothetical protein